MKHLLRVAAMMLLAGPLWAAELGDDGLHKADWMRDTFKDLQEDAAEASAEGKRLLILIEQRGCIYCAKMHKTAFLDPRVIKRLEEDFFPVQINLHGDTEVIDTDGEALSEKGAARKWGLLFTPTMIFLPPDIDTTVSASAQAVAVMPGAFSAGTTFDMLTWVVEGRYLDQSEEDFQRYHGRMIRERQGGASE